MSRIPHLRSLAAVAWVVPVLGGCLAPTPTALRATATVEEPASAGGAAVTRPVIARPRPLPPRVRLTGAPAPYLRALLGEPSLRRSEPPAEYWRYSFPRCTLDLFLYADTPFAEPKVVYWELRSPWPGAGFDGCADMRARFDRPAPASPAAPEI